MEILEKVEQLKAELDSLQPVNEDVEARIWQKFRLDWNYHSNKLEGNTYSFGETKMLLLKGLTAGGKPVRDHEEISGHDEAISFIIQSIRDKEELTEVFIRHLHKMILVRPFWADAKTPDGQPTKRLIKVGEYKTEPNHVETQTGAIFYFAEPIETPAKMQELVEWFRVKSELPETNALLLAAEFHYRFVRIHPFDDGNGRLARLLMNYILMKYGFPPVIIRNEDKDNYIAVLEQADFSILEPFVTFVAQNLVRSLETMIKGARGDDIEEPEDLDKELLLIEKRLLVAKEKIVDSKTRDIEKNKSVIGKVIRESVIPLMKAFHAQAKKFERFYEKSEFKIEVGETLIQSRELEEATNRLLEKLTDQMNSITLSYELKDFILESVDRDAITFESTSHFLIRLSEYNNYAVVGWNGRSIGNVGNLEIWKRYGDELSKSEIDKLVKYEIDKLKKRVRDATRHYEGLN